MTKKLTKKMPIIKTPNMDVGVSWAYTWARQQEMSIHEQRIILRIMEQCQKEVLQGVKLKDFVNARTAPSGSSSMAFSMLT